MLQLEKLFQPWNFAQFLLTTTLQTPDEDVAARRHQRAALEKTSEGMQPQKKLKWEQNKQTHSNIIYLFLVYFWYFLWISRIAL